MSNIAIILAGGVGTRLGEPKPKQLLKVAGKTVIEHTIDVFEKSNLIDEIAVVAHSDIKRDIERSILQNKWKKGKKMLAGGEDPLFIARRLCISAAEDVGLANPNALLLANACFQGGNQIGMPEARIPLSEVTIYLASSPKSNRAYLAIAEGLALAEKDPIASVPLYLRNAPTKLMDELGYSDGYKYAHDYPGNFVDQEFMPKGLEGTVIYKPQTNKHENNLKSYLEACWPKYYTRKDEEK